jgi:hypothetical protein
MHASDHTSQQFSRCPTALPPTQIVSVACKAVVGAQIPGTLAILLTVPQLLVLCADCRLLHCHRTVQVLVLLTVDPHPRIRNIVHLPRDAASHPRHLSLAQAAYNLQGPPPQLLRARVERRIPSLRHLRSGVMAPSIAISPNTMKLGLSGSTYGTTSNHGAMRCREIGGLASERKVCHGVTSTCDHRHTGSTSKRVHPAGACRKSVAYTVDDWCSTHSKTVTVA